MKYPIGIQTFEKLRQGNYVYIDKTDLVYSLATEGGIYFLSRPRRFGKSLLISTLESYFLGKKELFNGLKMEQLEKDWKVYPVIHIDFNGDDFSRRDALEGALNSIVTKLERQYHVEAIQGVSLGRRFQDVIAEIHRQTGMRVVVLVDEYDKPLLDVMETPYKVNYQGVEITLEQYNRDTLKSFYSSFKAADEHLQFVFLTGVTKFSQVSVFSGFNQPKDLTMSTHYETLCGISEEELETYFSQQIEDMAEENDCPAEKMKEQLKKQYDGYHFSKKMTGVYNPFSLLNAFQDGELRNYWFKTGTPTYLIKLLD
jgi:predicted DNA-binding ribbon-helix-helix protein